MDVPGTRYLAHHKSTQTASLYNPHRNQTEHGSLRTWGALPKDEHHYKAYLI